MASRASWPPALLGLPRFLAAALTFLCLVTLDVSAEASGGWLFHVDVVGTPKTTRINSEGLNGLSAKFTAPADAMNGISLGSFASGHAGDGASPGYSQSCSTSMSLSVKITATWQGTDPAPPSVEIIETGHSTASATIPTNYGTESVTSNDGLEASDATGVAYTPSTTPPAHLTVKSGGTWSITRSFSATSSSGVNVPASAPQTGYSCGSDSSLDSYSVSIHAQPYNYHKVPGGGNMGLDGSLSFTYDWSSTTGDKNNLTSCYWHEYVSYPGTAGTAANPNLYSPPSPPFSNVAYPNPTVSPGIGNSGGAMTGTYQVVDTQGVPPFVPPSLYTYGTFTATQVYEFDDTVTGETNVQIPGPDSGIFSIVREFKFHDTHDYIYTCTKDNHTASVLKPF